MRVLIVHYNPAAPGAAGGAESAIRDQRHALEMLGHEVFTEFVYPDRAYKRHKPDIIHFHTIHVQLGLGVLEWAQQQGIPHCLSLHDYWPFCSGRMLLSHYDQSCAAVEGVCDGQCDGHPSAPGIVGLVNRSPVVTFNPYSAAIYRRHGLRVDAIIPHSIDTDFFRPQEAARVPGSIITVSAWPKYPTKGVHVLKQALGIAGYSGKLVTGVSREEVRNELQKADIFVFPSCYEETWGLCLTEAMSCGCACIASSVCGPKAQIEHGKTGLLVAPRDAEGLASALRELKEDHTRARAMGAAARAWAEGNANLSRMGRDYVAFYRSVLDGS